MTEYLPVIIAFLASYILGATPFGFLAGKLCKMDIRDHGSGNIGATNVWRVLGMRVGLPVFALDFLKGLIPVLVARKYCPCDGLAIAAGMGAILGHNFTFWLGFKGGKGVATSAGVMFGLMPEVTAIALVTWMAVFHTTRYVAVASIVAALLLPVLALWKPGYGPIFWLALVVGSLSIWRHRGNIKRLRDGTENRFERRKKTAPAQNTEEEEA